MVAADPQNELGHFSLGSLLFQEEQFDEARPCFEKALALNPGFSKAHQLLGECWSRLNRRDEAIAAWKKGWQVAHDRGDLMPREAMARRLRDCGETPPLETSAGAPPQQPTPSSGNSVSCLRCGRQAPCLPRKPLPGNLGEKILHSTCQDCWKEWLAMGVKVVNELHLDLTSFAGATAYDKHMAEFLRIDA